jgi:hypothetical protein
VDSAAEFGAVESSMTHIFGYDRAEAQVKTVDCSSAVSGTMIGSKVEIHCLSKEDIARVIDELVSKGVVQSSEHEDELSLV